MPKMNGFDFLSKIKEINKKNKVIVLSNLGQEEDIKKAKNLGAMDFFIKSNVPISDIVTYIKKILN